MNDMFESISRDFGEEFRVEVLSTDPYIVVFENFLTAAECDAIVGTVKQWERSTDTGQANSYGEVGRILSQSRTSSNAWCQHECENDPDVINVVNRIERVTRVPYDNYESFQILRYEPGQFYRVHHDNGAIDDRTDPAGPRILTFFLYLSDVEEGGETDFPQVGVSVKPKKGRAVLWPSVLDRNPTLTDSRTTHQAKPVIRGIKFAANSWIHLYNFRVPNLWGCTGPFDLPE
jgi:prolyl 4-hydroxylase